jgi:hypothetical protein
MSMPKQRFKDRPPAQRLLALTMIAVSLAIVTLAERDLQHRPAEQVRGNKRLWRLLSLNALGSLAYLLYGRRRAPAS